MTAPVSGPTQVLVVAKAPVVGQVKTRLGHDLGMSRAAELAAAALQDTLEVCSRTFPGRCHLALSGALTTAQRGAEIEAALEGWHVFEQVGEGLGPRLASAFAQVGSGPVLQIGMDTPQIDGALLHRCAAMLEGQVSAVLGPAADGGWWLLGLTDPEVAQVLAGVPMSSPETCRSTAEAVSGKTGHLAMTEMLRDVDTVADAAAVAALVPGSHFGRAWARLTRRPA